MKIQLSYSAVVWLLVMCGELGGTIIAQGKNKMD